MIAPTAVVAWVMVFGLIVTAPIAAASGIPKHLVSGSGVWLLVGGGGNVVGLMISYRALRIGKVALVSPIVSTEGAIAALIAVVAGRASRSTSHSLSSSSCSASVWPLSHRTPSGTRSDWLTPALWFSPSLPPSASGSASTGPVGPERCFRRHGWCLAARLIGALVIAAPLALRGRLELTRRALPLVIGAGIAEVVGFFSYTDGSATGSRSPRCSRLVRRNLGARCVPAVQRTPEPSAAAGRRRRDLWRRRSQRPHRLSHARPDAAKYLEIRNRH